MQGMLIDTEKKEMGGDVAALDLPPVPEGRQRARFLAVGMYDGTARLLSLDPADTLKVGGWVGGWVVARGGVGWRRGGVRVGGWGGLRGPRG
jgi:hypothetical protein